MIAAAFGLALAAGVVGVATAEQSHAGHLRQGVTAAKNGQLRVVALRMGGDPPVITHVSRIVSTVFSGARTRFAYMDPCPCTNPLCRPGCLTLAGDPDDGGQISLVRVPAAAAPPTIRD